MIMSFCSKSMAQTFHRHDSLIFWGKTLLKMTNWLTDWPTDRPTDRPSYRSTDRLADWLTDWLTEILTDSQWSRQNVRLAWFTWGAYHSDPCMTILTILTILRTTVMTILTIMSYKVGTIRKVWGLGYTFG